MPEFIENILIGVRQWVNTKLENISYVVSSHVAELHEDVADLQDDINNLAEVATSGSYNDLTDKPTTLAVPTNISSFTNDSGYLTSSDITSKEDRSNKVTSISNASTDTQYPSAKCVYDEFATTVTTQNVETVSDVTLEIIVNIPIQDKSSDTSINTFAIDPNKMYYFGTRTTLTITFNAPTNNNIINEYMFQFTSGSTATTLNVPSSVKWIKDPDIQTNKKYGVSIQDNLGVIGEWSNE